MSDILYSAAQSFYNLLNKKYNLVLGFKGKTTYLNLSFDSSNFKHLSGLHKLTDLNLSSELSIPLFNKILQKEITYKDIEKSIYYKNIKNRLSDLSNYEKYLDKTKEIYYWSKRQATQVGVPSKINADYIFKEKSIYITNGNSFMFFAIDKIDKNNRTIYISPINIEQLSAVSFFIDNIDYSKGQKRYTLLYKEKIDLNTNKKEIIYKHHNFSLDTNENVSVEVAKGTSSEQQPTVPAKKSIYAMAMENQKANKQPIYNKNKNDISL